jgi:hypothetical protein
MSRENEEHTTFITVDGLFCYVSMPYGLKNALPTFMCAMHKTFGDLIRDLIKVYVDDIVVKIKSCASLLDNHALVLDRLRSTRTKLNPNKCVFRVTAGKLLGFLVSYRGIEANPEKIKTIKAMLPPTHTITLGHLQKLVKHGFMSAAECNTRGYCSSYSTSTLASTVFIQWWLQYKPNSMKMIFSTNGVGSF